MQLDEEEYLAHYGVLRRSGRYPWGSGGEDSRTTKNNRDFLDMVSDLQKKGLSQKEVAEGFGMSILELRAAKTLARTEQKAADIANVQRLKDKQYSNMEISRKTGIPEATVRSYLKEGLERNKEVTDAAVSILKDEVDKYGMIDVGVGTEKRLNISPEKLKVALELLKADGYNVHSGIKVPQLGTGEDTKLKVLTRSEITWGDVARNKGDIRLVNERLDDTGKGRLGLLPPLPINPKRVAVNYKEDGGADADGVLYVRPGVKDVSIGGSRYAQVRVQIGPSHYIKGMAMYKDDLPDGVDIVFNTNKSRVDAPNKMDVFKPLKLDDDGTVDKDNPFGAQISRQIGTDESGIFVGKGQDSNRVRKLTSVMNIVNEEGDWQTWSKNLSSQMLSKQSPRLIKEQLDMAYEQKLNDFDEIMKLTNPIVRQHFLREAAETADKSAVHLKAAAMPRQNWKVILPVKSLKETEVFAPTYKDGETVVLMRYPHGGTFEIPELKVNNKNREANKLLKGAEDSIGINPKVAERLSGADFDGDTVLVVPNNNQRVKTSRALEGLKNFDPKTTYKGYPGMKTMTRTNLEMGVISNLITDMTIKQASESEITRAIRHSMVVIDAEKHGLNYKQSEIDNGIKALKEKYQSKEDGTKGASTLISRAKSTQRIPERKPRPAAQGGPVDRKTGELVYVPTGRTKSNGDLRLNVEPALKLAKDANELSSGTRVERIYAEHSNRLKQLANRARLAEINTPPAKRSPSATKVYSKEVESLRAQLYLAQTNAPLERRAQLIANEIYRMKVQANPTMDRTQERKVKFQALDEARRRTGAKKTLVNISDKEWEAIQAGAISPSMLKDIIRNSDVDRLRDLARPKEKLLMTSTKTRRAKSMLALGYTMSEVAQQLGVSVTTLQNSLKGG